MIEATSIIVFIILEVVKSLVTARNPTDNAEIFLMQMKQPNVLQIALQVIPEFLN